MIRKIKNEFVGWAGQKLNGIQFNIDIINACSLRCPTCAIGSIGTKRGGKMMTLSLFRNILDKAQSECKVRKVQMYAYSDPCLHPELHLFIEELNKRGIPSELSTMLQSTRCDFRKVVEAGPDELRISFPGWDKMHIYQRGAFPDMFDRKIQEVCSLPRNPKTVWTMAYHLYNDNGDEVERARALADKYRLKFVILPAIFMPCEKVVEKNYSEEDKEIITHLLETPEDSISRMKYDLDYCLLWKQITIDAEGYVYLCQLVYEQRFKMSYFMSLPLEKIQSKIRNHSFCGKCMKAGGHAYQYCFSEFRTSKDPIGEADKFRRKSGINENMRKVLGEK